MFSTTKLEERKEQERKEDIVYHIFKEHFYMSVKNLLSQLKKQYSKSLPSNSISKKLASIHY